MSADARLREAAEEAWRLYTGWLTAGAGGPPKLKRDLGLRLADAMLALHQLALQPTEPVGALDRAWAAAEAVLPDGWVLRLFDYGTYGPYNPAPGEPFGQARVQATAQPKWVATAKLGILSSPPRIHGRGETPADALQALTAQLADRLSGGPE